MAPLLVSSSGTGQSSLPQSQLVGASSTKTAQADTPQAILDLSRPVDALPKGGLASMLLGNKRKAITLEGEDDDEHTLKRPTSGPTPIMINGVDGVEPASLQAPAQGVLSTPEFLRPAVVNPSIAMSQVRLAVPKVRSHILRPLEKGVLQGQSSLEDAAKVGENIILEAKNPSQPKDPSQVTATKRGALLWQDFLPRAVILVAGSKHFWAAACEDGCIYVWTPAGRRLISAMVLESQPVILESREHWLLCITAVGLAHVWNVKTMSSPHPPVSLAPILEIAIHSLGQHSATPGPGVTSAHLNSSGHIIVSLSNGDGYYYSPAMYTWQRLSESWWAVGSQYWNSNDSSVSALQSTAAGSVAAAAPKDGDGATASGGIIPFLERHTTNEFLLKGRAYSLQRLIKTLLARDGFENFEASVSIAHLENRIAGAMQLGARDEFRLYLFMYAKRIGAEGLRGKVEELLNSLLGGVLQDKPETGPDDGKGWFSRGDEICGWDRKELLKGVVMILGTCRGISPGTSPPPQTRAPGCANAKCSTGKFRELQRLTVQYARVLDLMQEDDGSAEGMTVEA